MKRKTAATIMFATVLVVVLIISLSTFAAMSPSVEDVLLSEQNSKSTLGTSSDGRIRITVHSFNSSLSISYSPYTSDLMAYVWGWIDISITNLEDSTINVNPLNGHLKDRESYMYNKSNVSSPKQLQSQELPAGETVRGELYFEIPYNSIITDFIYQDDTSYITISEIPTPSSSPPS